MYKIVHVHFRFCRLYKTDRNYRLQGIADAHCLDDLLAAVTLNHGFQITFILQSTGPIYWVFVTKLSTRVIPEQSILIREHISSTDSTRGGENLLLWCAIKFSYPQLSCTRRRKINL
jgi:hypothetical protein